MHTTDRPRYLATIAPAPTGLLWIAVWVLTIPVGVLVSGPPPPGLAQWLCGVLYAVLLLAAAGAVRSRRVDRRPARLDGTCLSRTGLFGPWTTDLHAGPAPTLVASGWGEACLRTRDGVLVVAADGAFRSGTLTAPDLRALAETLRSRPSGDAAQVAGLLQAQADHQDAGGRLEDGPLRPLLQTRLQRAG